MAHILLAEDDHAMRQFLVMALEKSGHTITQAGDGLTALAHLQEHDDVDLLLSDIVMPGMDGIELSQKAKALHPALKVMFITGFSAVAMDQEKKQKADQPPTKILSKPFHLNDLVEQVGQALEND